MSKHAQLSDGTLLEFPDDTPDDVMDKVVRQHIDAPHGATGSWGDPLPPPAPAADPTKPGYALKEGLNEGVNQLANVGHGVVQAVTGIPGMVHAAAQPLLKLTHGDVSGAAHDVGGMARSMVAPVGTIAQEAGALVAPGSVNAPPQQQMDQASRGVGTLAGGLVLPDAAAETAGAASAAATGPALQDLASRARLARAKNPIADSATSISLTRPASLVQPVASAGAAVAAPVLEKLAQIRSGGAPPPDVVPGSPEYNVVKMGINPSGYKANLSSIYNIPDLMKEVPELKNTSPGPAFDQKLLNGFKRAEHNLVAAEDSIPDDTPVDTGDAVKKLSDMEAQYSDQLNNKAVRSIAKVRDGLEALGTNIPWDQFIKIKRTFFDEVPLSSSAGRDAYQVFKQMSDKVSAATGAGLTEANKSYFVTKIAIENAKIKPVKLPDGSFKAVRIMEKP